MAERPIYAGSYRRGKRGRMKLIFTIIVLIHLAAGIYFFLLRPGSGDADVPGREAQTSTADESAAPMPEAMTPELSPPETRPETQALIADARALIEAGRLADAQQMLNRIVERDPDREAVRLLGDVNMTLLKSPLMMPGKAYYVIQSGDYLQKIAKNNNTTVELLKTMNGMENDTIRRGDRMVVFNGRFSIRVSKGRNELDLLLDGKLFKRYSVGTGKFGKTPEAEFVIVDKIIEPPWTRPSDGRQIEYGDPENVLGSRWMAIQSEDHPELTGFGIHGTWEEDSIGKQSSAGCIRMLNRDVEELFDLVPRKTSVIIAD